MSLLPHSFGTPLCRYVLCLTLFTLRFLLLRKGNSLCAMMILGLVILKSPSKLSRRELIMSIAAAKELMSFFSYFQALQLKTNHTCDLANWTNTYPGFDGAGKGQALSQGSRTQVDSKTMYEYPHWDCSSIYMPGIVLDLYCHQSSLRTVWSLMLLLRY